MMIIALLEVSSIWCHMSHMPHPPHTDHESVAVEPRGSEEKREGMEQGHCLAQHASTQANKPQAHPAHRMVDSSLLFQEELVLAIVVVQALHRPGHKVLDY